MRVKANLESERSQKRFDFDEHFIFLRLNLFSKRLAKLSCMLTTVDQFSSLSMQTHIDGLEDIVQNFDAVVDEIRRKPYDLLDFSNTQFDRDYMEFNVNIHELEMAIQVGLGLLKTECRNMSTRDSLMRAFQRLRQLTMP